MVQKRDEKDESKLRAGYENIIEYMGLSPQNRDQDRTLPSYTCETLISSALYLKPLTVKWLATVKHENESEY